MAPITLVVFSALLACKSGDDKSAPATTGTTATAPTAVPTAAPTAAPQPGAAATSTAAADTKVAAGDYPTDSLKTIADNCATPAVILASVPKKVADGWKDGEEWNWAVQAMLAHPQYTLVDDAITKPMEVKFLKYESETVSLVATCQDGGTCNKVAAMYKFTVPGAKPQVFCTPGKLPGIEGIGAVVVKLTAFGGADAKIPEKENVVGRCARLHVCSRKLDRSSDDDMGLSCQRAPSKHKTDCAAKKSCDEVVSCMKG